jgi:hypothetical protein
MKKWWLLFCAVCLMSCAGLAQVKSTVLWKCDKASDQHSINVGDKPGHSYGVDQINCTPTSGDIDGAKRKSGMGTEFVEVNGDKFHGHGEFVETMENGDKNYYSYQMKGMLKDGVIQSGSDVWQMTEGGGKLKGVKATGSCKGKTGSDGTAMWDCSGNYTMAK